MNYIPRIKVAQYPLRCSSLRQDIILDGQKFVKLGTKHLCLDCAGKKLTQLAQQISIEEA